MKTIIDPVPVELLKAELTKSKKLEDTNKGHNELYVVTWQDSPNVVTEIGRLRELAFREAGGSTGNAVDLDEYDKMEKPYKQLIVWDPDNEAIIGGYRFLFGSDAMFDEKGQPVMASSHQFRFSQKFINEYLPHVMELGRNFVAPEYQSSKNGAKSIFAFDNLWDGLVALIMKNPDLLYFFGKITVYPTYDRITRDLLEDYKLLKAAAKMRGVNIPPNMTAYISITSKMLMFGTAVNRLMHNIEDTCVLIPFDEIYHDKKSRHIGAYLRFSRARRRKHDAPETPEIEAEMIENWLNKRYHKVKRLLKKANREL